MPVHMRPAAPALLGSGASGYPDGTQSTSSPEPLPGIRVTSDVRSVPVAA